MMKMKHKDQDMSSSQVFTRFSIIARGANSNTHWHGNEMRAMRGVDQMDQKQKEIEPKSNPGPRTSRAKFPGCL